MHAHHGRHAVLPRQDRQVAQHAARLGDHRPQPRQPSRKARVEGARDQDVTGCCHCRVVDDTALGAALRGAAAARAMRASEPHPNGPALCREAEARGQWWSRREHPRREVRRGWPAGHNLLELAQVQVDQGLRRRDLQVGGQPLRQDGCHARRQLLEPPCPQSQGLSRRQASHERRGGHCRARFPRGRVNGGRQTNGSPNPRRGQRKRNGPASHDLVIGQPQRAAPSNHGHRNPGTGGRGFPLEQGPGKDLVAVHRRQVGTHPTQDLEQFGIAEVSQRAEAGEFPVDPTAHLSREVREYRPQPTDTPRAGQPAGRDPRIQPPPSRRGERRGTEQVEVACHPAVDRGHQRRGGHSPVGPCPDHRDRRADAGSQRVEPQVLLQRAQRLRERLAHRSGAEQGSLTGIRAADRRHRTALQQPQDVVGIEGPLDILGPPELVGGPCCQARDASALPTVENGRFAIIRGTLDQAPAAAQQVALGGHGPAHEGLRPPGDGLNQYVGAVPSDRVEPEQHAADPSDDLPLHQDGHRRRQARADRAHRGAENLMDCRLERGPAHHVQAGQELARHGRGAHVLHSRRRPHHKGNTVATEAAPRRTQDCIQRLRKRLVRPARSSGIEGGSRHDEAGDHR